MKYNEKYNLFVDDDFVIYRWDKNLDKLVQVKPYKHSTGYLRLITKYGVRYAHRIIWETFNGDIPKGYELDHINTIRTDNRLENLRCVNRSENMLNPITREHNSEAQKGKCPWNKGKKHSEETKQKMSESHKQKTHSEFGIKFKEYYGITNYENPKLYHKELNWYLRHNKKCRWEK